MKVWMGALLLLVGCQPVPCGPEGCRECGPEVCREDQLCVLPAETCVPLASVGESCVDVLPCVDGLGVDGCLRSYFDGACIDVPDECPSPVECSCIEAAVADALAPVGGIRCASVDDRGFVLITE
jgi:hypothetical protein